MERICAIVCYISENDDLYTREFVTEEEARAFINGSNDKAQLILVEGGDFKIKVEDHT